jgi:bifunctional UDP-N-acetylglucosamine pyrophosphorylase/glucosamine-1-phosphate N-acetyltransferase
MKSDLPKVLHPLGGKPLFLHPLEIAQKLGASRIAVVVGHGADAVRQAYSAGDVSWIVQEKQLGTGHAVGCARECFDKFNGELLILSGDVPLIRVLHYFEILAVALEIGARILQPGIEEPGMELGVEIVMIGGVAPGA